MKNFFIICLIIITSLGCTKQNLNLQEEKFVPGDLSIGVKNDADLSEVFNTLNTLQFQIKTMHGFYYSSAYPTDSISSLIDQFNQKPYINVDSWGASTSNIYYYAAEQKIRILCSEFNMDVPNQNDFLNAISSLNLQDLHGDTKMIFLKIPVGSEKYWLEEVKKYPIVKWTELNRIVKLDI